MKTIFLLFWMTMPLQPSFKESQLQFSRVKDAYREKEITVKKYFVNKNLNYQGYYLLLRAFKKEKVLEVWIKERSAYQYKLLKQYEFCTGSGTLGPKRKEGDGQIPEGFYKINHFNPKSNFHLSLGINYPNTSDKILSDKNTPGSSIYIHGNCVSIGCIPISDDKIKELYILAIEARNNGQQDIPVHIFPSHLDTDHLRSLESIHRGDDQLISFWKNLQNLYLDFEKTKIPKPIKVRSNGEYYL
jgi:murein L,D-transpeptidase YafK